MDGVHKTPTKVDVNSRTSISSKLSNETGESLDSSSYVGIQFLKMTPSGHTFTYTVNKPGTRASLEDFAKEQIKLSDKWRKPEEENPSPLSRKLMEEEPNMTRNRRKRRISFVCKILSTLLDLTILVYFAVMNSALWFNMPQTHPKGSLIKKYVHKMKS